MEINNTLIQGLAQAIIGGEQQAPIPPTAEPLPDKVEPSAKGAVAPELAAEPAQVNQADGDDGILTSGEKEILNLVFDGQGEIGSISYGSQPSRPVILGNFLDIRG